MELGAYGIKPNHVNCRLGKCKQNQYVMNDVVAESGDASYASVPSGRLRWFTRQYIVHHIYVVMSHMKCRKVSNHAAMRRACSNEVYAQLTKQFRFLSN